MSLVPQKIGLVLSGGGARGAYEAGVIHYLRSMDAPPEIRRRAFDIICGSSVGAINACLMASLAHDPEYQGERTNAVWQKLKQENVYRRDMMSFFRLAFATTKGVGRRVFRRISRESSGIPSGRHFRGFLNTQPLRHFLAREIAWNQIGLNIRNQALKAVCVTATNLQSGHLELFIQKREDWPYSGRHPFHDTGLTTEHVMGSAAIPLLFPVIKINRSDYLDGSLRLNTPMAPAIDLGADKLFVIGMHAQSEKAETLGKSDTFALRDPPTMGAVIGRTMTSFFLDRLDFDIEQLRRINRIIEWSEKCFGPDYLDRLNTHLAAQNQNTDIAARGLKKLEVLSIQPSRDLRQVFAECVAEENFLTRGLSRFERILLKLLDTDLRSGRDFLSFILFYPPYLEKLLQLGFADAHAQHDEIIKFFSE